jgi:ABC-type polysaccharide/polyol phosphate export permease
MVPEKFRILYLLNPVAGLLDLFHMTLYEGIVPSLTYLSLFSLQVAVIFMVGYVIFGRFKAEFAEVL